MPRRLRSNSGLHRGLWWERNKSDRHGSLGELAREPIFPVHEANNTERRLTGPALVNFSTISYRPESVKTTCQILRLFLSFTTEFLVPCQCPNGRHTEYVPCCTAGRSIASCQGITGN